MPVLGSVLSLTCALDRYELLIKHRFASHVIQTLLEVAPDTIAREVCPISVVGNKDALGLNYMLQSRGIMPKLEEPTDKGELRTLTQLILDFSEVCWISACICVLI
jgi:nucleolar protein 9